MDKKSKLLSVQSPFFVYFNKHIDTYIFVKMQTSGHLLLNYTYLLTNFFYLSETQEGEFF